MNPSFLAILRQTLSLSRSVITHRFVFLLFLLLYVQMGKKLEFKTDFIGMKFSFHAVNPAYSLIDDAQRDFFKNSLEFIPKHAPRVSLSIHSRAKDMIFETLRSPTPKSTFLENTKAPKGRLKIQPLIIQVTEAVANDKFIFRFSKISSTQIKVNEIIGLKQVVKPQVVVESIVRRDQLQPSKPVKMTLPLLDQESDRIITGEDALPGQRSVDEVPSFEGSGVENQYPKIITGLLDLKDGAHAGPDTNIVVYREYQGSVLESGTVDILKGTYTLHAKETKGRIVAEVRHPQAGVIARGYGNLSVAESTSAQQKTISSVDVRVDLVRQGLAAQISDRGGFKNKNLPGAIVSVMGFDVPKRSVADGSLENDIFTGASQYLLYAQKEGYASTLSFGRSEFITDLPMFTLPYLKDLYKLAYDEDLSTSRSTVFGRILKNGKPMSQSTIEVLNDQKYKVVYLDHRGWPNPDLHATTQNGGYFILGLNAGLVAIRASYSENQSEVKVLPADYGTLTKFDLELSRTLKASITMYERNNPQSFIDSKIKTFASSVVGIKKANRNKSTVSFAKGDDPLFIEVDGRDTDLPLTLTLKRTEGDYQIPSIERSWIEGIHSRFKIPQLQQRGVVVGFLDQAENFEVLIDQFNPSGGESLYYFDQSGEIIPQILSARNAAGYVVLNAQEGLRNILIRNLTTGQLSSDTAYIESGVGSLLIHEL